MSDFIKPRIFENVMACYYFKVTRSCSRSVTVLNIVVKGFVIWVWLGCFFGGRVFGIVCLFSGIALLFFRKNEM